MVDFTNVNNKKPDKIAVVPITAAIEKGTKTGTEKLSAEAISEQYRHKAQIKLLRDKAKAWSEIGILLSIWLAITLVYLI